MNFYSYFYYVCLSVIILFSGCKSPSSDKRLTNIVDLFGDEPVSFSLIYDGKGKLARFGGTSVQYLKNRVVIGLLDNVPGYGTFFNMSFEMADGKVIRSETHCEEKIDGKFVEVNKKSTYIYDNEEMVIDSKSYRITDNQLIRSHKETRKWDSQGRLSEALVVDTDKGINTIYYNYQSNFSCLSNLNLQAFAYFTYGLDDVLAYLLNLYDLSGVNVLPNEIIIQSSHGEKQSYTGNYCMDGDQLMRMEIMKDYEILASRLNFEYGQKEN